MTCLLGKGGMKEAAVCSRLSSGFGKAGIPLQAASGAAFSLTLLELIPELCVQTGGVAVLALQQQHQ